MSYQIELGEVESARVSSLLAERGRPFVGDGASRDDATADHLHAVDEAIGALLNAMEYPEHVRVAVVGHANPRHESREGYAEESITISIGVVHPAEQGDKVDAASSAAE